MAELSRNSIRKITDRLRQVPRRTPQIASVPRAHQPAFWARITAADAATGLHSWKRVIFDDTADDKFADWPATSTGTDNAYRLGGGVAAVDQVVRLYLAGQDADGKMMFVFAADAIGYELSPCDVSRATRYVALLLDAGGDPYAADDVVGKTIEIEGEGCYTVAAMADDDARCITAEKCVTVASIQADCDSGPCGDTEECEGDKKVTGTSTGQASEQEAIDAATEDALSQAESACGERGIDVTGCSGSATEYEGAWSAEIVACYTCWCGDGERMATTYRYTCGEENGLVETVDDEFCVKDKGTRDGACPA